MGRALTKCPIVFGHEVTLNEALRALRTDRLPPKQIEGEKIEEAETW